MTTDHLREVIWKPALKKAEIAYRPLMQTRHTFATLSLSEGENIGWVQHMLGHSSLQMIFTKYYAWIPKKTRNDGSAMMKAYEKTHIGQDKDQAVDSGLKVVHLKKCAPNVPHQRKRTYTESV